MPIHYETLMNLQIPEVRQTISKRDAALYALSCGLGADPMDEAQLDYVDFDRTMKILPSMPVILGYPTGFIADPRTGIDHVKVVHGEQMVALFAPLLLGQEVIGRNRIASLIDKGEGRGALMVMEREITDAKTGVHLATTTATIFLRGDGGFGGPATGTTPILPKTPDGPPDITIDLPTRPEQALYYRFNGDDNPLHAAPKFAARAGFPRPILHGLCTFGVTTHALLKAISNYNPTHLTKLGCRFSAPVFPGETIRTEIWHTGHFRARAVERDIVVVGNGVFEVK
ncbi:MAG: 3-alpha,7-alpha,12-alpha-trihydroxy-5-beta-cholest-24-enoyl-CoA hydratase [Acidocella sp. 21-58-7]|nr:MAG: 3-alpha,7-alpha,12-alpha-trihydroxy-5-beta-cholest-24-enoyl-CoA hydratase [Acidocella sp. 21-58-7]